MGETAVDLYKKVASARVDALSDIECFVGESQACIHSLVLHLEAVDPNGTWPSLVERFVQRTGRVRPEYIGYDIEPETRWPSTRAEDL